MTKSVGFLQLVLDTITEHIVVINDEGIIQYVNKAWSIFGQQNQYLKKSWEGVDYLKVCEHAAETGDELGAEAAEGIKKVMRGEAASFYLEYPCHSTNEKRWFVMRVSPFRWDEQSYFVISHQNITERKLLEEKALDLSRTDGLTNIANRRHFNEFLAAEWRRCARHGLPISLALIDIDHFKLLNDHDGHLVGDDCLILLATVLKKFSQRSGDLLARYGGEEFALIFGDTPIEQSLPIIHKVVDAIHELGLPHETSPVKPFVTVSIGLMTMHANAHGNEQDLLKAADMLLYAAKEQGRDRVVSSSDNPGITTSIHNFNLKVS